MKRRLTATYPGIDAEVERFGTYTRTLSLSLTRKLLLERGRIAAQQLNISDFKPSNAYIHRFIRRIKIQKSVTIRGKDCELLSDNRESRMEEPREMSGKYPLNRISNMD